MKCHICSGKNVFPSGFDPYTGAVLNGAPLGDGTGREPFILLFIYFPVLPVVLILEIPSPSFSFGICTPGPGWVMAHLLLQRSSCLFSSHPVPSSPFS